MAAKGGGREAVMAIYAVTCYVIKHWRDGAGGRALHAAEGGVAALAEVEVVAHVALEAAADDGVLRLSLSLSHSLSRSL